MARDQNNSHFTALAIEAALSSGDLLREGFGTSFSIQSKPGKQNLVTEYDKRSERNIIDLILKAFPDHNILAEESGESQSKPSPYTWIIDPLDGTVNFAHGVPVFCISIALACKSEIISGVVYHPIHRELYVAEKGKGAQLNQVPIAVSKTTHLESSLMATGFPYDVDKNPHHCLEHFTELQARGIPIRRFGAAALDLCYVAAGRFDGYWEVSLHPWDMAAGKLIVEEAGGKVTHYDGTPHAIFCQETILATNGKIHELMISHLGGD